MRVLVGLSLCFAWNAQAAERPKATADFVNLVRALPPEFHADLLLRIAESKLLDAHNDWRRELLEEAFLIGQRAPEAYPSKGGIHTDCRASVISGEFGLDAMSLRLRAVERMLPVDAGRAAAMFRETPIPPLPAVTCQSAQVPDFQNYYKVLGLVHKSGFTAKERERGERASLLKSALAGLSHPGQVEPLGRLLVTLDVSAVERQEFFDAFGGTLARVAPSDRGFARHENSLLVFVYEARKKGVTVTAVMHGLQAYIQAHLTGPRCSRSIQRLEKTQAGPRSPLALDFNRLASNLNIRGAEVPLIAAESMKPERDAGMWDDGDFWNSPRSKEVMADLKWLNHGNRDLPGNQRFWTPQERQSIEWTSRYQELQKRIEGWKVEEEPEVIDHFWMQSHALQFAAQLVPAGPGKALAMRRWLTHFEQGYRPGEPQNHWFGILRFALPSTKRADGSDGLEELLTSRNPVVAAYAQWEVLAPR